MLIGLARRQITAVHEVEVTNAIWAEFTYNWLWVAVCS